MPMRSPYYREHHFEYKLIGIRLELLMLQSQAACLLGFLHQVYSGTLHKLVGDYRSFARIQQTAKGFESCSLLYLLLCLGFSDVFTVILNRGCFNSWQGISRFTA